jgi:endonuclease/exonuclease/phosphatase family metal-dependent hydrolase
MKAKKLFLLVLLSLFIIVIIRPKQTMIKAKSTAASGQITIALEKVYAKETTTGPGDDDPYFPMIAFRSRFYESGSTEVFLANERLRDFTDLGEGETVEIPEEDGTFSFDDVHFSTAASIAAEGDFPEIIGIVLLGMENDASIGKVRDSIMKEIPKLEETLTEKIENGEIVNLLVDKLGDFDPPEEGNGDENDSCEGFEEIIGQLPSGEFSAFDELIKAIFSADLIDEDFFVVEFIDNLLLNPIADIFADDLVDIHIFAYVTVLENEFDLALTCEKDGRSITISTWPTVANSQPPAPAAIEFKLDDNPIVFKGDGGEWHVEATFSTTAEKTSPPPVDYAAKHPLLTQRFYLPLATNNLLDATQILLLPRDGGATQDISAITYNVQFLTPWDEGTIESGHWPNTAARAAEIGAALACHDIVVLNETVNVRRRSEILGAMNANSAYCDGRSGDSTFTWVSGPEINATHIITGWPLAIDIFINNIGEPLMDHEVAIASRYPIVESNSVVFANRYGLDALAAKGVLHARLQLGNDEAPAYLDVFATHLQAGFTAHKRAQVLELADFIYEHAEPDIPILLMGDFNIDGAAAKQADKRSDYNYLMNILEHLGTGHSLVDVGSHLSGGTNYSDTPDAYRTQRIDHIFLSNPAWLASREKVRILDFSGVSGKEGTLSDHAAVRALLAVPMLLQSDGPDLVVSDIDISASGVVITIKNIGTEPVVPGDDFWLDVYLIPGVDPSAVNQTWEDVGDYGLVWGILAKDVRLGPGKEAVLSIADDFFDLGRSSVPALLPAGSKIFAQVDSVNMQSPHGGVLEGHEKINTDYNNISVRILSSDISTSSWFANTLVQDAAAPLSSAVRDK